MSLYVCLFASRFMQKAKTLHIYKA